MDLPVVQRLKKELDELRYELKWKLPKDLEEARAHGDLSENAEYEAAKDRQAIVTARIGQIETRIRELSLYSVDSIPRDVVGYGSRVTVENLDDGATEVFELVFPEEVQAGAGQISLGSPLGRALLNKGEGAEIDVQTPKGKRQYQIVTLETLHARRGN